MEGIKVPDVVHEAELPYPEKSKRKKFLYHVNHGILESLCYSTIAHILSDIIKLFKTNFSGIRQTDFEPQLPCY